MIPALGRGLTETEGSTVYAKRFGVLQGGSVSEVGVKKLPSYQPGMEQGLEDGLEKGLEKGLDQGKAWLLRRQLQLKFGALSPELEARIDAATGEQIARWAERILSARSIEEMVTVHFPLPVTADFPPRGEYGTLELKPP